MDQAVMLLLLLLLPVVRSFSSGNVSDNCDDQTLHHPGLNAQTGPPPFTVTTDHRNYSFGEEVKVQLLALNSTTFTGFLLQAREVAGRIPVGSFVLTGGDAQLLTCQQRPNSAVSHGSDSPKTFIEVIWRPEPSADPKPIQLHASFVQNSRTFWVDVTSQALTFSNDSTNGTTRPSFSPTNARLTSTPWTTTLHQPSSSTISDDGCGLTKVCFSQPSNCDPSTSADCYFMSAMMLSPSDGGVRYEIAGPSDGYISFGFSDDKMMGNDDIYICGIGSNGLVQVQHAFSTGRTAPQALPLGNVSDVSASMQDKVISCSFISMNTISTLRTTGFNQTYHLMIAHGPSSNGKIQFHTATFISADKVDISRPQFLMKAALPHIIKAHGALMLIAWMSTGTLGMMVARYLKGVSKGRNLWGKEVWFGVHVAVMSVTIAATVIGFILSFSYAKTWSGGAHPVLGCLVLILSLLQPILALLRCGPQHHLRFLFNWSHALAGLTIKALSVAAIFTGLNLIDSGMDQWLMRVMGGFVGWEAVFYVLLEVHLKWRLNTSDMSESKRIDISLIVVYFLGNIIFLVALLVGIGIS